MLLTPVFGKLTDCYGPKLTTTIGLLLLIPPLILSSFVSRETMRGIPKLAALLSLIGLAFAIALPPIRVEATLVVKELEQQQPQRFGPNGAYERAFGLVNLMVATGGMVGPLYGGFVRINQMMQQLFFLLPYLQSLRTLHVHVNRYYGFQQASPSISTFCYALAVAKDAYALAVAKVTYMFQASISEHHL